MADDKSKPSFDELAAAIPTTLTGLPSAPPPKRSASTAPPPITPVKARGSWTPTRDAAGNRAPRWDKWGKMPVIHLWEGVALSLNLDPGKVRQEYSWMAEARFFDESQEFKDRLEVAERSVGRHPLLRRKCNSLVDPCDYLVSIDSFIAWAKSIGWDLPDGLLRSQPPKQNAPIEITLPAGGGGYMRLGDALETIPMLIATRIADESGIPRGVVVIGVQRIENGREIVKGPDDPEFQELLNSPEWERLEMDCEKEYQMFRNETAHECRMKFESAIKNGTLKVVNGFTDALIPIQSLKDWLASMGVDAKENRQPNDSNKVDITKSTPIETDDWRNNPSLTKGEKQRRAILEAIATKGYEPFAIPDGGKVTLEALCRDLYPDIFDGETSFGNAWKAGNGTHWRMANYASFSKRWER